MQEGTCRRTTQAGGAAHSRSLLAQHTSCSLCVFCPMNRSLCKILSEMQNDSWEMLLPNLL